MLHKVNEIFDNLFHILEVGQPQSCLHILDRESLEVL